MYHIPDLGLKSRWEDQWVGREHLDFFRDYFIQEYQVDIFEECGFNPDEE
jgi:hypothetical protein